MRFSSGQERRQEFLRLRRSTLGGLGRADERQGRGHGGEQKPKGGRFWVGSIGTNDVDEHVYWTRGDVTVGGEGNGRDKGRLEASDVKEE